MIPPYDPRRCRIWQARRSVELRTFAGAAVAYHELVNRSFPAGAKIVVGVCAVVGAAAALTLAMGAGVVQHCGAGQVLGLLQMFAWVGYGIVPICIALFAVGSAVLMPELRRPRWWLLSAALLTLLAVADVAAAHARFPTPSNPAWCTL